MCDHGYDASKDCASCLSNFAGTTCNLCATGYEHQGSAGVWRCGVLELTEGRVAGILAATAQRALGWKSLARLARGMAPATATERKVGGEETDYALPSLMCAR